YGGIFEHPRSVTNLTENVVAPTIRRGCRRDRASARISHRNGRECHSARSVHRPRRYDWLIARRSTAGERVAPTVECSDCSNATGHVITSSELREGISTLNSCRGELGDRIGGAEFTPIVCTPTIGNPIWCKPTCIVCACSQRRERQAARDRGGSVSRCRCAVAQRAIHVPTPAIHCAAGNEATGMSGAGRDLCKFQSTNDCYGTEARVCVGAITHGTELGYSPTECVARLRQRTGMIAASADIRERVSADHRRREPPRNGRAIAKTG